jgi:DNA-directed RNA polymerase subunit RPC12/RpoP
MIASNPTPNDSVEEIAEGNEVSCPTCGRRMQVRMSGIANRADRAFMKEVRKLVTLTDKYIRQQRLLRALCTLDGGPAADEDDRERT